MFLGQPRRHSALVIVAGRSQCAALWRLSGLRCGLDLSLAIATRLALVYGVRDPPKLAGCLCQLACAGEACICYRGTAARRPAQTYFSMLASR